MVMQIVLLKEIYNILKKKLKDLKILSWKKSLVKKITLLFLLKKHLLILPIKKKIIETLVIALNKLKMIHLKAMRKIQIKIKDKKAKLNIIIENIKILPFFF
jgi:hypothetical protein